MSTTNPFPGMNPFMERSWPDVHLRLIGLTLEALGMELPDDLIAKAEENVDVLAPSDGKHRGVRPDIAIVEPTGGWEHGLPPVWTPENAAGTGAVTVTEPQLLIAEEPPHRWIEIRTDSGDLVTVIEVLSPANKTSHREAYRAKRRLYVAAGVNVVEIDLLRGGQRTVNVDYTGFRHPGEHYLICASRGVVPGRREVYPCPLRERLPVIRIPLRVTDPDVPLDIQALVDRCYTTGRYWKFAYRHPITPPLNPEDAAWVEERLAAAGLQS